MKKRILRDQDYRDVIEVTADGVVDAVMPEEEMLQMRDTVERDRRITGVLVPETCLRKRIREMAARISRDYANSERLDILIVLTGAIVLASDLCREIHACSRKDVQYHLIKTSVYDNTIKSEGETQRQVRLDLSPRDIEGRDILILEDILDQGFTLSWLMEYLLKERKARSVRIICLVDKKLSNPAPEVAAIRKEIRIDYTGFILPDVWIAGYGIDAAQELRNLPCIVAVDQSLYL